jgi:hypothetical protein
MLQFEGCNNASRLSPRPLFGKVPPYLRGVLRSRKVEAKGKGQRQRTGRTVFSK